MARFTSGVTGINSSQIEHFNSSIPRPLVNPPELFILCVGVCSIARSLGNPVQTRFETFAGLQGEYLGALTSSVSTCMMNLHIGDVLMRQNMVSFHEQFGDATSSC